VRRSTGVAAYTGPDLAASTDRVGKRGPPAGATHLTKIALAVVPKSRPKSFRIHPSSAVTPNLPAPHLMRHGVIRGYSGISVDKPYKQVVGGSSPPAPTVQMLVRHPLGSMGAFGDDGEPLEGVVEIDETFVGGHQRGKGRGAYTGNKTIVAGMVERGGDIRFRVVESRDGVALGSFIKDNVAGGSLIYTDDYAAYKVAGLDADLHETVNHSKKEYVRGDVHTNSVEGVWSLLKRSIVGSYHQLSVKHLPAYLGEIAFRFNNRENPYLFRDTLLALLSTEALTYEALIA
jgi:transposase-like protein